jgi:hypothetical protein
MGLRYRRFEAAGKQGAKELKALLRRADVNSFTHADGITVVVGPIPVSAEAVVSEIAEGFGASLLEVV